MVPQDTYYKKVSNSKYMFTLNEILFKMKIPLYFSRRLDIFNQNNYTLEMDISNISWFAG